MAKSSGKSVSRKISIIFLMIVIPLILTSWLATQAFAWYSSPNDSGVAGGIVAIVAMIVAWILYMPKVVKRIKGLNPSQAGRRVGKTVAVLAVLGLSSLAGGGCTMIDPAHVGIKVNKLGANRGVSDVTLVTGWVMYNPAATSIFQYPTFVQTAVWTQNPHEGKAANEEITFNSSEGLVISGDISLSYQISPDSVPHFYVKFRSDDLDHFTHGILRNIARDAFSEIAAKYGVAELYGEKKEQFIKEVKQRVNDQITTWGVHIEQFGFIGALRIPDLVMNALNAKIQANQNAIMTENQIRQAEAEAKKAVAKAQGEAEANRTLSASIDDKLLRWRQLQNIQDAIAKWDGRRPTVEGSGSGLLLQIPVPSQP
ncbi:MAG: hypothetical protein HY093_02040 [Candidatus Liptonbacteria bacterium]|nr:hypothetical protein [Candidatus Liptonbacteria bacterium]